MMKLTFSANKYIINRIQIFLGGKMKQFERNILLLGEEAFTKLNNSHVVVVGAGGVGGFAIEALIRAGLGEISIVDFDTIDITNINRQIIATHKSIGEKKTEAFYKRALEINPNIKINLYDMKVDQENVELLFKDKKYDYIVDCIDSISAKIALIEKAKEKNIEIISAMGAGNKLNPGLFKITDISKTSVCPMAKVIRRELKKRRIKKVKVIFSTEEPIKRNNRTERKPTVGSISFVPSVVGLMMAGEVIKDICIAKI